MINLNDYEDAKVQQYSKLDIKKTPMVSWDFNAMFYSDLKNSFVDLKKINKIAIQSNWKNNNWDLLSKLKEDVIVLTDAKLNIVFASHNLYKMNGYKENEVLGKSPKMFQGAATSMKTSNEIRESVLLRKPFKKTVLNYKKTGELYHCLIESYPVFNTSGELIHFIAFEKAA